MSDTRGGIFDNELHDRFGQWPVGYISTGGAEIGDVISVAEQVGNGDDSEFCDAWVAAGDAREAEARMTLDAGHRESARILFLRASCLYAAAYHPLYGEPADPRLLEAFGKQMASFRRGMELSPVPVEPVSIPFEDTPMPAYLVPAAGREEELRPLLILTNGYDATITDLYFASGVAAAGRGYHVLMFDGPGQGEMLYRHGITLRPDWEVVIGAVIDFATQVPIVDREKIALSGWSLGGYLAPRAASGEHRLAACIADPGQWDLGENMRGLIQAMNPEADLDDLDRVDRGTLTAMENVIKADPGLNWSVMKRGYWANGVDDLQSFISRTAEFTLKDRVGEIRCPTLLTAAENDPLAAATEAFHEALTCPKALMRFTAAEGAGDHCEMTNRSLLNLRVLDWLDDTLDA